MSNRRFLDYLIISFKGMAMGAADVVPGVSGGTIAFIAGIYEELLGSINAVNFSLFKTFKEKGIKSVWQQVNGNFLLALLIGIGFSVFTLAKLVSYLLENQPILLWSFFFGLVLASVVYIAKQISKWQILTVIVLLLGAAIAYYITTLTPLVTENASPVYLMLAGALAICAMILPGISGAFILVLLGAYKFVLDAVHNRDIQTLAIVAGGAVIGLLTFSRVLKWLFSHYRNITLALLTGFIIGSLNKIWPWKETLTWRTNSKGIEVPLKEASISPSTFDGDPQLIMAIVMAIVGFILILGLEQFAKKYE
ncbi:DUF368 domain-containing protein [Urechidicola sp. KH5]